MKQHSRKEGSADMYNFLIDHEASTEQERKMKID